MYKLIFSKLIDEDIDSCYLYIRDTLQAPMAAEKLMKELYEKLDHIREKPYSRPLVQDKLLASFGIRSIKVKNYLLFYNIEEDEAEKDKKNINVITFMYSKRDWINILKETPLNEIIKK
ncbi:MAG: type II toxin-antitoxin system RelE/ParE family toxin [Treponema sp.]|nr:type II toxin-antitoxin system RelE/ParE family toxin [Treponema sp.]MCL2251271.1 type II toxin-antitoxin system RelE/ParE family toxin [Treponema sp.]